MSTTDEKHPANLLHPCYLEDRKARELSLAFKEGTPAFRRDWSSGRQKWMRAAMGELEKSTSPEYRAGMAVFDQRMERYLTSNHYGDSLRTSASQPFDYQPVFTGWDATTESRLRGEGIGLDGAGSSMRAMHASAYVDKLFAGIHFIRVDVAEEVPIWVQTEANSLLNWRVALTRAGMVLAYANVESRRDSKEIFRTIYVLGDKGVSWETYVAEGQEGAAQYSDPLLSTTMRRSWKKVNAGLMKGLWSVPLEPFAMFWNTPFRSPVPFADAAEIQLTADIHRSLLGSYRQRVSNSPAFVISEGDPKTSAGGPGYGTSAVDENAQPRPVRTSHGAVRLSSDQAKADWKSLDTMHLPQESEIIKADQQEVMRKCQDPLFATYKFGPTTATEVATQDARSMSWLRLSVMADIKSLQRLAMYTAFMSGTGASPDSSITIHLTKSTKEKASLVDRVQAQAESGIVGKRVVWKVCHETLEGYPSEEEIAELSSGDLDTSESTSED